MDLTLKDEVEKIVSDIFSRKKDSDKKDMLVKALKEAKIELEKAADELINKDSEIEDLNIKLEESVSSFDALNVTLKELEESVKIKEEELAKVSSELEEEKAKTKEHEEALEKKDVEISSIKDEFEKVSSELEEIKKNAVVEKRMSDLEAAGLLRSDDDGIVCQREKVSNFSDEEYETYKKELEEIKSSIIASLKKNEKGSNAGFGVNLEGDDEPTVKDIGEAIKKLFYEKKDE